MPSDPWGPVEIRASTTCGVVRHIRRRGATPFRGSRQAGVRRRSDGSDRLFLAAIPVFGRRARRWAGAAGWRIAERLGARSRRGSTTHRPQSAGSASGLRRRPAHRADASDLTIRLGRQEIALGSGRLISAGEGLNVRRGFDGVRRLRSAVSVRDRVFGQFRPVGTDQSRRHRADRQVNGSPRRRNIAGRPVGTGDRAPKTVSTRSRALSWLCHPAVLRGMSARIPT